MELELGKIITEDIVEKFDHIDNPEKVKKREYHFIKKLVIESTIHHQIEIEHDK